MNKKSNNKKKKNCSKKDYAPKNNERKPDTRRDVPAEVKGEVNNPEWRKFNDLLADQVMSFPFTSIAGGATTISSVANGTTVGTFNPAAIMRFDLNPSVGFSDGDTSAANQSARYLFTKLSANNMKTTQYGPQDVLMALLSLGEVVSVSAYCRRALGILGTVNPRNWYYPKAVIEAMGIEYDDFVKNAAIYRTRYNYIVAIASAIAFPADIKYFDSCRALFNDVFLDHTSGLAQTYMFVPATYWNLNEAAEGGSALETVEFVPPVAGSLARPTMNKFSVYLDKLEGIINNLMTSATLQYLYADVLKYVGNNGGALLSIETVPDDYSVLPVYSEEVLGWIENSVIVGAPEAVSIKGSTPSNNVTTDAGTNTIQYHPVFTRAVLPGSATVDDVEQMTRDFTVFSNPVLNFHADDPSINERIIATRFVPGDVVTLDVGETNKIGFTAVLPDHYIVRACIMGMRNSNGGDFRVTADVNPAANYSTYSSALFLFHRRPRIVTGAIKLGLTGHFSFTLKDVACELDNYTSVDATVMGSIQNVSNLALFRF